VRNLYQVPGGLQDLGEHFRRVLVVVDKEDALLCFRTREGNRGWRMDRFDLARGIAVSGC